MADVKLDLGFWSSLVIANVYFAADKHWAGAVWIVMAMAIRVAIHVFGRRAKA